MVNFVVDEDRVQILRIAGMRSASAVPRVSLVHGTMARPAVSEDPRGEADPEGGAPPREPGAEGRGTAPTTTRMTATRTRRMTTRTRTMRTR